MIFCMITLIIKMTYESFFDATCYHGKGRVGCGLMIVCTCMQLPWRRHAAKAARLLRH